MLYVSPNILEAGGLLTDSMHRRCGDAIHEAGKLRKEKIDEQFVVCDPMRKAAAVSDNKSATQCYNEKRQQQSHNRVGFIECYSKQHKSVHKRCCILGQFIGTRSRRLIPPINRAEAMVEGSIAIEQKQETTRPSARDRGTTRPSTGDCGISARSPRSREDQWLKQEGRATPLPVAGQRWSQRALPDRTCITRAQAAVQRSQSAPRSRHEAKGTKLCRDSFDDCVAAGRDARRAELERLKVPQVALMRF